MAGFVAALFAFGRTWMDIEEIALDLNWFQAMRLKFSKFAMFSNEKLGDSVREMLGDVRFEEVSVGRVDDVYKKVSRTLDEEEQDNEMALDITPGRKAMVLGSLLAGWKDGKMSRFEHVFYLYIESLRNASRPFMLIPMSVQRCHDIPRESRGPEIEF